MRGRNESVASLLCGSKEYFSSSPCDTDDDTVTIRLPTGVKSADSLLRTYVFRDQPNCSSLKLLPARWLGAKIANH